MIGMACLGLSLVCDGITGGQQTAFKKEDKKTQEEKLEAANPGAVAELRKRLNGVPLRGSPFPLNVHAARTLAAALAAVATAPPTA